MVKTKANFELSPFHVTGVFLQTLKISENLWFADVFRGIERGKWHEIGQRASSFSRLIEKNEPCVLLRDMF